MFYRRNVPTVVQQGHTGHLVSVCVNNYNGIHDAAAYVRGYKQIGFVGWEPSDFNIKARLDSFRNTIEEAGLKGSLTGFGALNIDGGYAATAELLGKYALDAVIYAADIMAYGGIRFLRQEGIDYPGDIGIMGFDDACMSEVLGLCSMYQLLDENADLVIENLLDMIADQSLPPAKEILLTPKLVAKLVVRRSLR